MSPVFCSACDHVHPASRDDQKTCEACGAIFYRGARKTHHWRNQRFCSNACGHKTVRRIQTPLERLENWSIPEPNTGCWIWLGALTRDGYGDVHINGRRIRPHRVALEVRVGRLLEGLWALHTCDNRWCINPDHLYAGTVQDNTDDRVRRGRSFRGPRQKLMES
jgi:hypothetical protein